LVNIYNFSELWDKFYKYFLDFVQEKYGKLGNETTILTNIKSYLQEWEKSVFVIEDENTASYWFLIWEIKKSSSLISHNKDIGLLC
jgi:hypothetical protein